MRDEMLPLICGDPNEKPASYTRFVLPFAYSPQRCDEHDTPGTYERRASPSIRWRRRYLTMETAGVLLDRAQWLRLSDGSSKRFDLTRDERTFTVQVNPPELVLMEWPASTGSQRQDTRGATLQIGFLIVEACFPDEQRAPRFDDFLWFNEHFRYWQQPFPEYAAPPGFDVPLELYSEELSNTTSLADASDITSQLFRRWASFFTFPVAVNGQSWRLFPPDHEEKAYQAVQGKGTWWDSGWVVSMDHRAFVWTCALLREGSTTLVRTFPETERAYDSGYWIKLLNVDAPGRTHGDMHASTAFEREWVVPRTYRRWEELGTLYGFNPHSGAMLAPPLSEPDPPLWRHFGEMYFDQTLLLLYLRLGSMRFSRQLSQISAQARDTGNSDAGRERHTWQRAFQDLRWDFALFTNLYEFPHLSNQQQGVEMYTCAREHMDITQFFREIKDEIASSHEYLQIAQTQEQTSMSTNLTVVATMGLIAGLSITLLDMQVVYQWINGLNEEVYKFMVVLAVILFCFFFVMFGIRYVEDLTGFFRCLQRRGRTAWFTDDEPEK